MTKSLSIRDLQKVSADTIRSARHPIAIRSNGELIAWIHPVPEVPPVDVERAIEAMNALQEGLTDEEKRALEASVGG